MTNYFKWIALAVSALLLEGCLTETGNCKNGTSTETGNCLIIVNAAIVSVDLDKSSFDNLTLQALDGQIGEDSSILFSKPIDIVVGPSTLGSNLSYKAVQSVAGLKSDSSTYYLIGGDTLKGISVYSLDSGLLGTVWKSIGITALPVEVLLREDTVAPLKDGTPSYVKSDSNGMIYFPKVESKNYYLTGRLSATDYVFIQRVTSDAQSRSKYVRMVFQAKKAFRGIVRRQSELTLASSAIFFRGTPLRRELDSTGKYDFGQIPAPIHRPDIHLNAVSVMDSIPLDSIPNPNLADSVRAKICHLLTPDSVKIQIDSTTTPGSWSWFVADVDLNCRTP